VSPLSTRPQSQEEILAEELAAFPDDGPPPEDADEPWPDPDSGPPAWIAGLSDLELDELLARATPASPAWRVEAGRPGDPAPGEAWPAGCLPRDGTGGGTGFGDGGVLDVLAAGLVLAGFAEDAHQMLHEVSDDALIGVLRAWRRVASWAAARELAAVAELARRRPADGTPPAPVGGMPLNFSAFLPEEVGAALTLTHLSAVRETRLALDLAGPLADTAAALAAGRIDLRKAELFSDATLTLTDAHTAAVEGAVLPEAPDLTTGQLRRALARAVLAADPDAARRQREEALKEARVDCYPDPAGTATLAGRNLPAASVLAADKRLCAIAKAWKKQGAAGEMDLLRARAYLTLLLGLDVTVPPADLLPVKPGSPEGAASADHEPVPAGQEIPAGLRRPDAEMPPLAGSVNLTIPLSTLMGLSDAPGAAAGYGPLDPDTARVLACAAAGHRATRWHVTVTGPTGRALGYGSRVGRTAADDGGAWEVSFTAEPIAAGCCDHRNREDGYRPSPGLQRLIQARSHTCTAFGCGRPATSCDQDHSIPYDEDGITCECNLAPLCRFHHRMKQAQNWKIEQISPGVMAWLTPAGRRYITLPSQHPT
jgi:hypothetical protein